jgi:methionyl-tRNA formyltransferase
MKRKLKILFFGRKNDLYTKKIEKFLKKKNVILYKFYCENSEQKPSKKIINLQGDLIICFRSFYILKKKLLNAAKFGCINFHPSTPKYRGVGSSNFALLNKEKIFGVTAHLMDAKIDNGKILNVMRFKISKKDHLQRLLNKAYTKQVSQVYYLLNKLFKNHFNYNFFIKKSKKEKWSKIIYTKKDLKKLYQIPLQIKKPAFNLRIRATVLRLYYPYIKLYGKVFYLKDDH